MYRYDAGERLVKYGFIKKQYNDLYNFDKDKRHYLKKDKTNIDKNHADQEFAENTLWFEEPTGFPEPEARFRIIIQEPNISVEDVYFWMIDHLSFSWKMAYFDKITDVFSAAESSAFWGVAQQRIGMQQDKVSNFMAVIGKMVKELFQLVREIRILKEKLEHYDDSMKGDEASEITLKGYWIDMVEGGSKNPASVYGMAREVGFATLPDLFFSVNPDKKEDVDKEVDKLDFNRKVKEVLKRKLKAYMVWKDSTYKELNTREKFTLRYLRQHWDVIKMYMNWVKPYLRNIQRMQMKEKHIKSADIIGAFETSVTEIEVLARRPHKNGKFESVVLLNLFYRTSPTMSYNQEYQKGPLHMGTVEGTLRAYAWTNEQIEMYEKMKDEEDMELLKSIDNSVKAAMEALGEELEQYLKEAEAKKEELPELKEEKKLSKALKETTDPFLSVFKGFGSLFGALIPTKQSSKTKLKNNMSEAKGLAKTAAWQTYKNFKKSRGLLHWS